MSYQVLARKWRPQSFQEMIGQKHVLRALTTALNEGRLHHAYLFTGTRGVGKTTVARIFAKSLNCEQGVSATPCGQCRSCQEIVEGRYVDLIEVDAASRTKVEDTRELLDNVQYTPTRGRFKIYLIDEVHMLSGHSFNALLKTLEEPPAHVKFLLATTDPQKLPVTVLSRCLQFNLKRMSQGMIAQYLEQLLNSEQIQFEPMALQLLAKAADGSMRDALSLTDQAIVTGGGIVSEAPIRDMLGMLPQGLLAELLAALIADDAVTVFSVVERLGQLSTDFTQVAENLLSALHQIALRQVVPSRESDEITPLVQAISAADVQLYYQIALHGRRDIPLAPDARSGFEMMVLRMLAFRLDNGEDKKKQLANQQDSQNNQGKSAVIALSPPLATSPIPVPTPKPAAVIAPFVPTVMESKESESAPSTDNAWHAILPQLGLTNMALQIAQDCLLVAVEENRVILKIDTVSSDLRTTQTDEQIAKALAQYYQRSVKVDYLNETISEETPALRRERVSKEQQQQAVAMIEEDAFIQQLKTEFDAVVIPSTIKPNTPLA